MRVLDLRLARAVETFKIGTLESAQSVQHFKLGPALSKYGMALSIIKLRNNSYEI